MASIAADAIVPATPVYDRLLSELHAEFERLYTQNVSLSAENTRLYTIVSRESDPYSYPPLYARSMTNCEPGGGTNRIGPKLAILPSEAGVIDVDTHQLVVPLAARKDKPKVCIHEMLADSEENSAEPDNNGRITQLGSAFGGGFSSMRHASEGSTVRYRDSTTIQVEREMKREFRRLVSPGVSVTAEDLYVMKCKYGPNIAEAPNDKSAIQRYKDALSVLNEQIQVCDLDQMDDSRQDELQLCSYMTMFHDNTYRMESLMLSATNRTVVKEMGQIIINCMVACDIAEILGANAEELFAQPKVSVKERVSTGLDFVVLLLIIMNVATITLSLDIDKNWPGWQNIEFIFTILFLTEIFIRIGINGCSSHFCGPDSGWNIFDVIVVMLGVADMVISSARSATNTELSEKEKGEAAGQVMAMRILRLLRVVKMVRMLRLKVLKELRLMVNGLLGGLRTIFWAFVFLFFFILILGITTRTFLGSPPEEPACMQWDWNCTESQKHLAEYRDELFSNVPRCMFTLFRCFISDGCSSISGVPLMPLLWDEYGWFVAVIYVLCFSFLTFGLFNLIMATIVESTMEAGKQDDAKRRKESWKELRAVARCVHKLVQTLCNEASPNKAKKGFTQRLTARVTTIETRYNDTRAILRSRISAQRFLELLDHEVVTSLLEQLGVATTDPHNYIETFDANEDGLLSTTELVKGLLKLRGSVEKADVVANLMVTRDMQRSIRHLEAMYMRDHHGHDRLPTSQRSSS